MRPRRFFRRFRGRRGGGYGARGLGHGYGRIGPSAGRFCGVVGIKPGYGRISRYGVIAFASSADQVGVLAANVADSAKVLEVLSGKDVHDSTSLEAPVPAYADLFTDGLKGVKVGLPKGFLDGLAEDIKQKMDEAAARLKELGAELVEVDVPHAKYAAPCYYIITSAEASSNLGRYDGIRYGYADNAAKDLNAYYEGSRAPFGLEVKNA